ncbi:hypothetical protein [Micromonospora sp. NBC_01813]|uniref:hypothetical protein n=1 Tax=Micromonospora sp. NBC_01813 TaxID=2975988 RepID=UPI002DD93074|nr:hypothetical protein [Micromonospora sp. NBC_01813]WSA06531.1 hypothetical protein OG958_19750 [Micromonospora sp. NBC_01813]
MASPPGVAGAAAPRPPQAGRPDPDRGRDESGTRGAGAPADGDDHADDQPTSAGSASRAAPVPVSRTVSLTVAGFSVLLALGLIIGGQTAGPGIARVPFAVVIFGVQLLFVISWTLAIRPPAMPVVGAVGLLAGAAATVGALMPTVASLAPVGYAAAGGFVAAVLAQLIRPADRTRVTESLGATLQIVVGAVAFATLLVLSRLQLGGTQTIVVALAGTGSALMIARLTDAVLARPRLAPQVPRGAAGVVLGAMGGTLTSAVLGIYVVGFTPVTAAVVGLVAASAAVLVDLATGYAEASRQMAGDPPTMWVARHMQGPLGGFALAAPLSYALGVLIFS